MAGVFPRPRASRRGGLRLLPEWYQSDTIDYGQRRIAKPEVAAFLRKHAVS
jgi:hypothetical protein